MALLTKESESLAYYLWDALKIDAENKNIDILPDVLKLKSLPIFDRAHIIRYLTDGYYYYFLKNKFSVTESYISTHKKIAITSNQDIFFESLLIENNNNDQVAFYYLANALTRSSILRKTKIINNVKEYLGSHSYLNRDYAKKLNSYANKKINTLPRYDKSYTAIYEVYLAYDYTDTLRYIGQGIIGRSEHVNSGSSHNYKLNKHFFYHGKMKIFKIYTSRNKNDVKELEAVLINLFRNILWNNIFPDFEEDSLNFALLLYKLDLSVEEFVSTYQSYDIIPMNMEN